MTTSLSLTVNASRQDLNDYLKQSADARGECKALSTLFSKLASGAISGSVLAQKGTAAAVRASGTFTLTYNSISNNDTCVVGGITLTCVTGTPTGAQFKKQTDATVTAANLAALINSLTTLNIYVSATSALGVVTITANQAGVTGNLIGLTGSAGIAASAAALASGASNNTAPTTYSRGL